MRQDTFNFPDVIKVEERKKQENSHNLTRIQTLGSSFDRKPELHCQKSTNVVSNFVTKLSMKTSTLDISLKKKNSLVSVGLIVYGVNYPAHW